MTGILVDRWGTAVGGRIGTVGIGAAAGGGVLVAGGKGTGWEEGIICTASSGMGIG